MSVIHSMEGKNVEDKCPNLDEAARAEVNADRCKIRSSRESVGGKYRVTVTQYVHDVTTGKDVIVSTQTPGYLRRPNNDRADYDKRIWSAAYDDNGREYSLGNYHYGRGNAEFAVACQFMRDEERRVADELEIAAWLADALCPGTTSPELRELREELLSGGCSPAVACMVGSDILARVTGVNASR